MFRCCVRRKRGTQAEQNAANKENGNRYGRQPQVTLRNFTSVSI